MKTSLLGIKFLEKNTGVNFEDTALVSGLQSRLPSMTPTGVVSFPAERRPAIPETRIELRDHLQEIKLTPQGCLLPRDSCLLFPSKWTSIYL